MLTAQRMPLALGLLVTAAVARGQAADRVTYERLDARVMAGMQIPGGPLSYLVTPSHRVFRVLGSQNILDADGTKLGILLSYVGDTRDPEAAAAHSQELIQAWGPEAAIQGETAVLVQARVGFDPRKGSQTSFAHHVAFRLQDARWTRLPEPPPRPDLPKTIGTGPLEIADQPGFPYDRRALDDAGKVVARWLGATDAADARGLRAEMSKDFLADVDAKRPEWERGVAGRAHLQETRPRRELYRIQTWIREPTPERTRLEFAFSVEVARLGPAVEKIMLVKEEGRWRVGGYGLLVSHAQQDLLQALLRTP